MRFLIVPVSENKEIILIWPGNKRKSRKYYFSGFLISGSIIFVTPNRSAAVNVYESLDYYQDSIRIGEEIICIRSSSKLKWKL